jgi:hypothetical protein
LSGGLNGCVAAAGGGGSGAKIEYWQSVVTNDAIVMTIGIGGSGGTNAPTAGTAGGNTVIQTPYSTATLGGGGGGLPMTATIGSLIQQFAAGGATSTASGVSGIVINESGMPGSPGILLGALPYTSAGSRDIGISGNGGGPGGGPGIVGGLTPGGVIGATSNGNGASSYGGGGGGGLTLSAGGTNAFATGGSGFGGFVEIIEYHM